MLPDSDDFPARCLQERIRLRIPLYVALELRSPVLLIRPGNRAMVRAKVPEATIDEDSDLRGAEDDVRPAPDLLHRPDVDSVSKPEGMQLLPDRHLWTRVARAIRLHDPTPSG